MSTCPNPSRQRNWARNAALLLTILLPVTVWAGDYSPDPRSVRRHGPAYRYPQAGWIVLHIEGKPYERGIQHGRLMATEIAAYVRCFAAQASAQGSRRRLDRHAPADQGPVLAQVRPGIPRRDARASPTVPPRPAPSSMAGRSTWSTSSPSIAGRKSNARWRSRRVAQRARRAAIGPGRSRKPCRAAKAEHCSAFAATGPATARRQDRLRPHHHVRSVPGPLLQRLAGRQTREGRARRSCSRTPAASRAAWITTSTTAGLHRLRNDHRPDAFRRRRHSADEPHPQGHAVRQVDRRRGESPLGLATTGCTRTNG